jgi:hypothetical protein
MFSKLKILKGALSKKVGKWFPAMFAGTAKTL